MLQHTRKELDELADERLQELINHAGGPSYLAKMLGKNLSTVSGWIERKRISKKGARLVEKNVALKEHFKANYLRPDL